jgi:uncharacterized protein
MAQVKIPYAVIQPTQICNFDCRYCYLPDRQVKGVMRPDVVEAVAEGLAKSACPATLNWHAGEPMTTGKKRFVELLRPFEILRQGGHLTHAMQTNASLVDDGWCDLILEYGIKVGTSIDGDRAANAQRVDWRGRETFDATMRGIETLKRRGIPFTVIAVVNEASMRDPRAFYEFFLELGCASLGINIEEQEGLNANAPTLRREAVRNFWRGLWNVWIENPALRIRELSSAVEWMRLDRKSLPLDPDHCIYWPTISVNGDVVVLSPELAAAPLATRRQFVVGNVLSERLDLILARVKDEWYVRKYFEGTEKCRATCDYYSFCRGGMASNKFFATGRLDVTETNDCINRQQAIVDTMFEVFE